MIITRWEAALQPSREQLVRILSLEGLEIFDETLPAQGKIKEHRHPFSEVRVVLSGELLTSVSGNQVLLRPGDRIEIPANTKHSYTVQNSEDCVCLCGQRVF